MGDYKDLGSVVKRLKEACCLISSKNKLETLHCSTLITCVWNSECHCGMAYPEELNNENEITIYDSVIHFQTDLRVYLYF